MASPGLGVRLRHFRNGANYSQQEIADVLGVAREVISYWENDRRAPSFAQLARLAESYGETTGSLLGTEPPPVTSEEHELVQRGIRTQPPRTKAGIRRWLAFLDDWADLLAVNSITLPGRATAPNRAWRAAEPIRDTRQAPRLARSVREHYALGADAIPDLLTFLDQQGILVYRVALDPIETGSGVSGVTCNHPRLGSCILVNTATTPGRQTFTLAHELAHALFHYQELTHVSRAGDTDQTERFADAFAAHFLAPGDALRKRVAQFPGQRVSSAYDAVDLQRGFRVSYAIMLNRLRDEGLLAPERYQEYRGYSPSHLAAQRGLGQDDCAPLNPATTYSLGCYPNSVLDRVSTLISQDNLSPEGAADLLQVPLEEILGALLATPEPANAHETREFAELPPPASRRSERTRIAL